MITESPKYIYCPPLFAPFLTAIENKDINMINLFLLQGINPNITAIYYQDNNAFYVTPIAFSQDPMISALLLSHSALMLSHKQVGSIIKQFNDANIEVSIYLTTLHYLYLLREIQLDEAQEKMKLCYQEAFSIPEKTMRYIQENTTLVHHIEKIEILFAITYLMNGIGYYPHDKQKECLYQMMAVIPKLTLYIEHVPLFNACDLLYFWKQPENNYIAPSYSYAHDICKALKIIYYQLLAAKLLSPRAVVSLCF